MSEFFTIPNIKEIIFLLYTILIHLYKLIKTYIISYFTMYNF